MYNGLCGSRIDVGNYDCGQDQRGWETNMVLGDTDELDGLQKCLGSRTERTW